MVGVTRRAAAAADASAAAETVLRLAVLLQAGVAPGRAWTYLAEAGDKAAGRVADAVDRGMTLPDAIASVGASPATRRSRKPGAAHDVGWAEVARAWRVATTVGAPLAESLRGLAAALRDAQEAADEVRVALAEPAGTARLMGWLPLVAVGLGTVLGFDTFGSLVGHPVGLACLFAGVALIALSRLWTTTLVARARGEAEVAGHTAELLAIALSGGVSIERATDLVAQAGSPADPDTDRVLTLSRSAGVPAVELLRASAALARHRARIDGRLRAARLSSRLLLPLGVCTLPAFLFLGVAPMVLSVVSTMSISW
ncbi:type II secretion system F family protein [Microbacterium insulae]|uniref:Type II secretion system F family protein n=1 Tax=Microbacterium insulae TaxID=483014 RepID=A0ABW3AIT3_9MICO